MLRFIRQTGEKMTEMQERYLKIINDNLKLKKYTVKARAHGGGIGHENWKGWTSNRIKINDTGEIFYILIRDDTKLTDEIIDKEVAEMKEDGRWYSNDK